MCEEKRLRSLKVTHTRKKKKKTVIIKCLGGVFLTVVMLVCTEEGVSGRAVKATLLHLSFSAFISSEFLLVEELSTKGKHDRNTGVRLLKTFYRSTVEIPAGRIDNNNDNK